MKDENSEEFRSDLLKMYDHDAARDLALEPVRSLLDKHKVSEKLEDRRKLVDVSIDDARLPIRIRSIIPGSIAVAFRLKQQIQGVLLTLVASKRYKEEALRDFVLGHRFSFVDAYAVDSESENYKHLVFTRLGDDDIKLT
jgi:hypothetical protein